MAKNAIAPKISTDTIIRTVVLIITLFNQILTMTGKNPLPFSDEEIYAALTSIATAAAAIWAWWKNNSFTAAAREADAYMDSLKAIKDEEAIK